MTDDERLLDDLGRALGPDPAPSGLVDRADALFAVRDLDPGLAALLDPEAAEPAGMRGGVASGTDRLTFEVGDGSVTVEVTIERERITGRILADAALADVTLERPAGAVASVRVGEFGEFAFARAGDGPVRLRLDREAGPLRTDWFLA